MAAGVELRGLLGNKLGEKLEKRCFLRSRHSLCERFAPHSSASSLFMGGGGGELGEGTETGGQKEAVERGGERAEGSRREAAEGDTRGK